MASVLTVVITYISFASNQAERSQAQWFYLRVTGIPAAAMKSREGQHLTSSSYKAWHGVPSLQERVQFTDRSFGLQRCVDDKLQI